jgi:hypothetical protein
MPIYKLVVVMLATLDRFIDLPPAHENHENGEPTGVKIIRKEVLPLKADIEYVLRKYFPEIRGVYVYSIINGSPLGRYYSDRRNGWSIALHKDLVSMDRRTRLNVIGHELTHLTQYKQDYLKERALKTDFAYIYATRIPKGEESCDIYTYARSPELVAPSNYFGILSAFWTLYDWRSIKNVEYTFYEKYCVEIHELAKEAIKLRANGYKRYIKWFINRLNELASVFVGSMFENDINELRDEYGVMEG